MNRPASGDHRIRSLHWRVAVPTAGEAFAWRSFLHAQGTELLVQALAQHCDAAASDGEVLRIPRLELRLRLGSPDELATLLPEAIRREWDRQLDAGHRVARLGPGEGTPSAIPAVDDQKLDDLLHYLRTGFLPWRAAVGPAEEMIGILAATLHDQWPAVLALLRQQRQNASFLFRLLHLVPDAERGAVLAACLDLLPQGEGRTTAEACLAVLRDEAAGLSRHARLSLLAAVLVPLTGDAERLTGPAFSALLAASIALSCDQALVERFLALLPEAIRREWDSPPDRDDPGAGPEGGKGTLPLTVPIIGGQERPDPVPSLSAEFPSWQAVTGRTGEADDIPAATPPHLSSGRDKATGPDLYPLRVGQAGLVLLHPYLSRLFVHCGLMEPGEKRLAPSALPRMAVLLHYLATGRDKAMEFELGLIKVLLGLDPPAPVPVCEDLLAEADKREAQALLAAVVGHWSALQNTSPEGLRASFLERPGLLRPTGDGWQLNVERKGRDILLERLPWSIALVRLPWMPRLLLVEW